MPFTLWRGNQLIGELAVREHTATEFSAVVLPAENGAPLTGVMQTRTDTALGAFVFQELIDPFVSGASSDNHTPEPARCRRRSAEEALSHDQQLSIRDDAGVTLVTAMIVLTEFQLPSRVASTAFPELPNNSDPASAWMVVAVLDVSYPAT